MYVIITKKKALTSNSNVEAVADEGTENFTGIHYGMSRSSNSYDESNKIRVKCQGRRIRRRLLLHACIINELLVFRNGFLRMLDTYLRGSINTSSSLLLELYFLDAARRLNKTVRQLSVHVTCSWLVILAFRYKNSTGPEPPHGTNHHTNNDRQTGVDYRHRSSATVHRSGTGMIIRVLIVSSEDT
jgi:hypothetical protein